MRYTFFLLLLLSLASFSQTKKQNFGAFATAVFVDVNDDKKYYSCTGSGYDRISQLDFVDNLGVFKRFSGDLKISGAEIKSFAKTNGNVCLGKLKYILYRDNKRPKKPKFNSFDLPLESECGWFGMFQNSPGPCSEGDQKWQAEFKNLDLTASCPGNYTLEVYFELIGSHKNNKSCDEVIRVTKNESGFAFKMNFSIIENITVQALAEKTTVNEGESIKLLTKTSIEKDEFTYKWTGKNFTSTEKNPIIKNPKANQSGVFLVEVTSKCGNVYSDKVAVLIKPKTLAKPIVKVAVKNNIIVKAVEQIQPQREVIQEVIMTQKEIKEIPKIVATTSKESVKSEIELKKESRYSKLIKSFVYSNPKVEITISDYDVEDGDLLSVFYNDVLIASKIEVKKAGHILDLLLDESKTSHEIVFVAENFGRISPNTSQINMMVDGKPFLYRITTSSKSNAKFVLSKMKLP